MIFLRYHKGRAIHFIFSFFLKKEKDAVSTAKQS